MYRSGYTQSFALAISFLILSARTINAQQNDYTPSNVGPFEVQLRTDNPLREPFKFNYRPTPTAVDIDKDGDIDVAVADYDGGNGFHLLRNDGTVTQPAFNRAKYLENPFGYISFDDGGTLTFTDIDSDGDLDMLFGTIDGTFRFYKRTNPTGLAWTIQSAAWNPATKSGNPMFGQDLGAFASPVFNDMDNDGDLDLVIGSSYLPLNKSMHYFVNDGNFNFTPSTLSGINPNLAEVTPTFLDVDNDGDEDIVIGAEDGKLYYFKRTGQTSFEEQTGENNPFNFFYRGQYSSPTAADFDNDGDNDLVVGVVNSLFDFAYIENKGNGVYEEKTGFGNPFGGASVTAESSPAFVDVDGDGDQDVVVGSSDNTDPYLKYFRNDNGAYVEVIANNPFSGTTVPNMFVPSFVDIDGDGDKDLLASADNTDMTYVEYFKNENGAFVRQDVAAGPFADIYWNEGRGDFSDIDNDGDFDLIATDRRWEMGDYHYFIRYFENTGTTTAPSFTEKTGTANPLNSVFEDFELFPRFYDIDHDGDLDALIGEGGGVVENTDGNEFHYYENVSSATTPTFRYRGNLIQQGTNPYEPAPSFTDQDNDGDLDIFFGTSSGDLVYYKNINPAAMITINTQALDVSAGTTITIDPTLTLTDVDSDSIVFAQVTVSPYDAGRDLLEFTPLAGIEGAFNATTGVLRFSGKASLADYQLVLQSVTLRQHEGSFGGRRKGPTASLATVTKTVSLQVADADRTNSAIVARTVNIISASAPVFADETVAIVAGTSMTVDLKTLITDQNNDINLSSLAITQQPSNGNATLNSTGILTVDFGTTTFAGSVTIALNVCDDGGLCDAATLTVNVTNAAPVFTSTSTTVSYHGMATVNLGGLITDPDANVNLGTLTIVNGSQVGGTATVSGTALTVDYGNVNVAGNDNIQLRVCDAGGSCADATISITIQNAPPVIQSQTVLTRQGSTGSLNLLDLTSDVDNNLDASTFAITQAPASGATAQIEVVSDQEIRLTINYAGVSFSGTDQLTVRACDEAGACSENVISIEVSSEVEIYNAVAPNSSGDNKFFRILNLPEDNKVSVFSRWGDVVYEAEGYDNNTVRFEGIGTGGTALPSATYFYKIEYYDPFGSLKTITGYLSLKQ
ncbi:MAG TPA: FG-GAP-like repeat-containing protein [Chryseosolibacter sp.]